jgi:nitric oxide reductase activation protein
MSKLNVHDLTPEGLTFAVIKDYIIERSKSKNSLFINVSDGCPSCYVDKNRNNDDFGGNDAIEFTAKQVKEIANAGIKIISFFINSDPNSFQGKQFVRMYGNASQFIDVVQPLKVANVFNKNIKKA